MVRHNDCTIKIEGALKSMKISFSSDKVDEESDRSSSSSSYLQFELETERKRAVQRISTPLDRDDMKFDGFGSYENFRSRYSRCSSIDDDRDYSLDCGINWSVES